MTLFIVVMSIAVLGWLAMRRVLAGIDLSAFDHAVDPGAREVFGEVSGPSPEHQAEVVRIRDLAGKVKKMSGRGRLDATRQLLEELSQGREFGCRFIPVVADGVPAEWVLAPGVQPSRRVLYIHGGAFVAGSPRSHRSITTRFSEIADASVLAVDYRLMPEHRRRDGIEDCRSAYRWLLDNGPDGPEAPTRILVGGDSAGGNLALMLAAWVRDQGLPAPGAVVALSPLTDATHSGPSILRNLQTDVMLGPLFSALVRVPRPLLFLSFLMYNRALPTEPAFSPIFGNLAGLPPILVQVSEAEMLLDDAVRYVNKARASGTDARLQCWRGLMHVWQAFYPQVPEAREAFDKIGEFVNSV